MLRLAKEEAEKPEKEAKEQHQKLWEGMLRVSAAALTRGEPGLGVLIPEQFCCAVLCPWLQALHLLAKSSTSELYSSRLSF